ncbi:Beta-galactosidase GanA [Paenibacillus sp. UNC496MF]|uniref:alpha-amylase family protein n=1 Tax=Paenibacillus sp. UNC496MF TaxID=1502753 RepID=UPI0008F374F8|nr:alpha-amylase family protein [Paenibacillus sp. UNC496MF]SFJ76687.1 Beta-galactosidase GanA [Paenibacillus sp. UNC496MF]
MSKPILFYDPSFPFDGVRPSAAALNSCLVHCDLIDAKSLTAALDQSEDGGCLIHLHGAFFPKAAWTAMLAFLRRGGGLISIGLDPFTRPVTRGQNEAWQAGHRQTAYLRRLRILETLSVSPSHTKLLKANSDLPLIVGYEGLFAIGPTCGFVLEGTQARDLPDPGAGGPMDLHIYPLLRGISEDGREVSAPAVLIEHTKGDYAGTRWIFLNIALEAEFWGGAVSELVRRLSHYAAEGVTELWLKSGYACYEPNERPMAIIRLQDLSFSARNGGSRKWQITLRVRHEQRQRWETSMAAHASAELTSVRIPIPLAVEPGLYELEAVAVSPYGVSRTFRQGFWGQDTALLAGGEPLQCGRDYFRKAGRPFPIVGMTYMAPVVARNYLFLPDVTGWDRDMAAMKAAGINLIRTGLWNGWSRLVPADGHPSEEALRALDAFILTAARHGLEVTFTFFAFTPELFEGVNPYLDPRSLAGQKRLVAVIAERYREAAHVNWDLINEPSIFDPKRLWSLHPSGDDIERQAFAAWLEVRHGTIEALQERWNRTPDQLSSFADARPPERSEINFDITDMAEGKRGEPWLDFCLFAMDCFNDWASELAGTIRKFAPERLVTVGQDEAFGGNRPTPFFYGEAVDYTSVHSWWGMDDLLWDGVFAKTPDKPNLVQETGIMYVENPDGSAKRSEEELRNILERKYAYAFASGGAGAVQWIWNTNIYIPNINESMIGALRADGTQKPEAEVSYHFGCFMAEIRDLFEDREPEEVAIVYPYTNDFSNRPLAAAATTRLTRLLGYELQVPFRAFSEYHLEALAVSPTKLIIVPSPCQFSDEAWEQLLAHVHEHGGTLFWSGMLARDAYGRPTPRAKALVGPVRTLNVMREETIQVGGVELSIRYGGTRIAELRKEVPMAMGVDAHAGMATGSRLHEYHTGKGRLIWSPLPLELGNGSDTLRAVYAEVLKQAGVMPELIWLEGQGPGIYGRKLTFRSGALFIFVSESASDCLVRVKDRATGVTYAFRLERERSVLFAADGEGRLLAIYRSGEVDINCSRQ